MARLTKGYAFAYQVLGYLFWEKNQGVSVKSPLSALLSEYDEYLETYSYEKIWSELPPMEKRILSLLSEDNPKKNSDIREALGITSADMSSYRDRLIKKGLICAAEFGYMTLALPRMSDIIRTWE